MGVYFLLQFIEHTRIRLGGAGRPFPVRLPPCRRQRLYDSTVQVM